MRIQNDWLVAGVLMMLSVLFLSPASEAQEQTDPAENDGSDAVQKTKQTLKETRVSMDVSDVHLHRVLKKATQAADVSLSYTPSLSSRAREISATFQGENVPIRSVLRAVLQPLELDYQIRPGELLVGNKSEILKKKSTVRIYDLRDLLMEQPSKRLNEDFEVVTGKNNRGGVGGFGGGGGGGGKPNGTLITPNSITSTVFTILQSVKSDEIVSSDYKNGRFMVNCTEQYHDKIQETISMLRKSFGKKMQVTGWVFRTPHDALMNREFSPGIVNQQTGKEQIALLNEVGEKQYQFHRSIKDRRVGTVALLSSERKPVEADAEVSKNLSAYEASVQTEETGFRMEFQPVIDRKVNRARLVLHSFLNASISSEDYTVKSLNRSADEEKNETEDHTFSMLHQALHGGARSIVVRDGDWLFLHSGGSGGNVESNVVLALRLTLRGEENPHPDPGPVPEWKKSMMSTLKEAKPDRLPSNNVRLHHLAQMMTEKTTVNMYLTNDLQTRSRKGKLTVNLPDNENWSVKNYLDHVRKRTDVEYDLLPNLVVLRGNEENDFQRRELYFYDLSNYTETVEHPSLPDKLRTEVKTEGKKAKSGGGGKEGGSSSFVGSSFSTSRKKSDRFGAGMQPDELKGVIQKSVDSVSGRHSMINVVGNRLLAVYNRPQVHHRVASIVRENASFPRLTDFVHVSLHSIYSEQKQRLLESIPLEQRLTEQQTDTLQSFLRKDEVVTRGQWTMASTGPESMFAAGGESVTGPESLSPTLKENAGAFDPQIVSKRATLAIQSRTMVPAHGENKKMRVLLRISEGRFTRSLPEMKKRLEGGDVLTLPVKKRDQLFSWQLPRAGTVVSFLGSDASTRPVLIRVRIWQSERSED